MPRKVFFAMVSLLYILSTLEWFNLIKVDKVIQKVLVIFSLLVAMAIISLNPYSWFYPVFFLYILIWSSIIFSIITFPKNMWWNNPVILTTWMFITIISAWLGFVLLREEHTGIMVVYLVVFVAIADSAAFGIGKLFGSKKLAKDVSPGKTIEGFLGAVIVTTFFGYAVLYNTIYSHITNMLSIIVLVVLSVIGDLFISMLKRNVGMKDTGRLLPGHGGLLDRIDSISAISLPFAYFASKTLIN